MENLNLIIEQIREIYGTRDFIPLHSPKFGGKEKVYLEHWLGLNVMYQILVLKIVLIQKKKILKLNF